MAALPCSTGQRAKGPGPKQGPQEGWGGRLLGEPPGEKGTLGCPSESLAGCRASVSGQGGGEAQPTSGNVGLAAWAGGSGSASPALQPPNGCRPASSSSLQPTVSRTTAAPQKALNPWLSVAAFAAACLPAAPSEDDAPPWCPQQVPPLAAPTLAQPASSHTGAAARAEEGWAAALSREGGEGGPWENASAGRAGVAVQARPEGIVGTAGLLLVPRGKVPPPGRFLLGGPEAPGNPELLLSLCQTDRPHHSQTAPQAQLQGKASFHLGLISGQAARREVSFSSRWAAERARGDGSEQLGEGQGRFSAVQAELPPWHSRSHVHGLPDSSPKAEPFGMALELASSSALLHCPSPPGRIPRARDATLLKTDGGGQGEAGKGRAGAERPPQLLPLAPPGRTRALLGECRRPGGARGTQPASSHRRSLPTGEPRAPRPASRAKEGRDRRRGHALPAPPTCLPPPPPRASQLLPSGTRRPRRPGPEGARRPRQLSARGGPGGARVRRRSEEAPPAGTARSGSARPFARLEGVAEGSAGRKRAARGGGSRRSCRRHLLLRPPVPGALCLLHRRRRRRFLGWRRFLFLPPPPGPPLRPAPTYFAWLLPRGRRSRPGERGERTGGRAAERLGLRRLRSRLSPPGALGSHPAASPDPTQGSTQPRRTRCQSPAPAGRRGQLAPGGSGGGLARGWGQPRPAVSAEPAGRDGRRLLHPEHRPPSLGGAARSALPASASTSASRGQAGKGRAGGRPGERGEGAAGQSHPPTLAEQKRRGLWKRSPEILPWQNLSGRESPWAGGPWRPRKEGRPGWGGFGTLPPPSADAASICCHSGRGAGGSSLPRHTAPAPPPAQSSPRGRAYKKPLTGGETGALLMGGLLPRALKAGGRSTSCIFRPPARERPEPCPEPPKGKEGQLVVGQMDFAPKVPGKTSGLISRLGGRGQLCWGTIGWGAGRVKAALRLSGLGPEPLPRSPPQPLPLRDPTGG
ncbi:collagen alpha-1(I) chain-like [Erythrolamprus reginae]|uniref:collagen alpha-1(I) chain-like n=1 Tax=Erythrolamprus reginae TaxID=121349 RepID=UPI00396CD3D0